MPNRAAKLTILQARLRAMTGIATGGRSGVLPLGLPTIDAALPASTQGSDGGLPLACLHRIAATAPAQDGGSAATGFTAWLAARLAAESATTGASDTVLWLTGENTLYPPGLCRFGLAPARLIVARASAKDLLWSLEQTARSGAVAVAIGETGKLGLTESRRLQLAAENGRVSILLLDTGPAGPVGSREAMSAVTCWRIGSAASRPAPGEPGVGEERWDLALIRCRGGRPGAWTVEWRGDRGLALIDPADTIATTALHGHAA